MERQIFVKSGTGRARDFLEEHGIKVLRLQPAYGEESELVVRSADFERAKVLLDRLAVEGLSIARRPNRDGDSQGYCP